MMTSVRAIIVFILVFLADGLSGQRMVLRPNTSRVQTQLGFSAVFRCSVQRSPTNTFSLHWIGPNVTEITMRSGRVYVETERDWKKVYITLIQESDVGNYSCRSEIAGTRYEKSIELVVYTDITFDDAPIVQNPVIGSEALIRCKLNAIPAPQIFWRYEGAEILYGERFVKEADGLRIYGINETDNGNYTCQAEVRETGFWKAHGIKVIVHVPPEIILHLGERETFVQGTELKIYCKARGYPPPTYYFYKDNGTDPIYSIPRVRVNETSGELHFLHLDKLDEGRYTCLVVNRAGRDTAQGTLRVLVPPCSEPLQEVVVSEGKTAIIVCRAHGDPIPEMNFYFKRKYVHPDLERRGLFVYYTYESGSTDRYVIVLLGATPADSGDFKCTANSSAGFDSRSSTLRVEFHPRFHDVNETGVEHIWAGKTRNLTCKVSSEPAATIEWFHHGNGIIDNETFRVYRFEGISYLQVRFLNVDQSWIYGQYICRATNKLGTRETTVELRAATPPNGPQLVELVERFLTAVVLRATPPTEEGGVPMSGYRVQYEDKTQNFSLCDQIRIENLNRHRNYTFRVRATNEVGSGPGFNITVSTSDIRKRRDVALPTSLPISTKA